MRKRDSQPTPKPEVDSTNSAPKMTSQMASFLKLTLVGDGGVGKVYFHSFNRSIYNCFNLNYRLLKSCLILQYMYGDVSVSFIYLFISYVWSNVKFCVVCLVRRGI